MKKLKTEYIGARLTDSQKDLASRIGQKVTGSPNVSAGIARAIEFYAKNNVVPRLRKPVTDDL